MPKGVYVRTEEMKRNIGLAGRGRLAWNKGLKLGPNPEHSKRMMGRKASEETKRKMSVAHKGFKHTTKTRKKISVAAHTHTGVKNSQWKGGITPQSLIQRRQFIYTISPKVMRRDDFMCVLCGDKRKKGHRLILHVDHIKPWTAFPELRFDIKNCRTLCRKCHYFVTYKEKMPENSRWGILEKRGI